jgi:hypothetical protein
LSVKQTKTLEISPLKTLREFALTPGANSKSANQVLRVGVDSVTD